jgi:hypothetical protein
VNELVEQCRREWRRLRVPKRVANEMAAELEADLAEAGAEGVSSDELVGDDPRAFAASWAAARGVGRSARETKVLLFGALAVFLAVAITGAALALLAAPGQAVRAAGPSVLALPRVAAPPSTAVPAGAMWISAAPEAVPATGSDTRKIGEVLLIVGLAGTATLSLVALWRRTAAL